MNQIYPYIVIMKTLRKSNKQNKTQKNKNQKKKITNRKKGGTSIQSRRRPQEEIIPILEISEILNLLFEIYDDIENRHYLSDFLTEFEQEYRTQIMNIKKFFGTEPGSVNYNELVKLVDIILKHLKKFLVNKPDIAKKYIDSVCNIIINILKNELISTGKLNNKFYPPLEKLTIFRTILHALFI